MHFAEFFAIFPGQRQFNVSINGTQVLTAFDVYAAAGAKNKAIAEQFTANASASGAYLVQFSSVVNNSLVRTPVQVGVVNNTRAEITSGLTPKDVVARASGRVRRLLDQFPLYPEIDLDLLLETVPVGD